ncbi:DgyrCDS4609 [Dimorphilus gyrociliatus]|uniref:DgyrCDS4609 n=1 Tax=Dimorphilus gyrociliatus TaxID=2664684 RepID=A0A7I8VJP7_9ANNE|nr:DgyrCDS4609 [Dimorphilus gyrociliatus]
MAESGCNVENAVLNCGVCAEVTAISKAVSEGFRNFQAILVTRGVTDFPIITNALYSNLEDYISPCGQCRQVMAEFNTEIRVYMTNGKREIMCKPLRELLPLGIGSDLLSKNKTG